jgi:hypothetical protein
MTTDYNFLSLSRRGTYFANVCYLVDSSYISRRFNGIVEDLSLMLSGFVELTDWVLRSTDWDQDGIPDNLGLHLFDVSCSVL